MIIKYLFLLLLVLPIYADSSSFIIKSKNKHVSKNELKSIIGDNIKKMMDESAAVVIGIGGSLTVEKKRVVELGEILRIVGDIQKKLSMRAQNLVENSYPFKKASSVQLEETKNIMIDITDQLHNFVINKKFDLKEFKSLQTRICSCHCLK